MGANTKYRFRARIWVSTKAASDFKWRHVGPASPSFLRIYRMHRNPSTGAVNVEALDSAYSAADLTVLFTGDSEFPITIEGIIHNGANPGDFEFHWAQNAAVVEDTRVRAGSFIEYAVA